jgi:putative membrane protein
MMWRLAALMGGLAALWIAVGSPLAWMDHHWLTAHMAQHLLLMTVAAPLIFLGAPAIPWPQGLARLHGFWRLIAHPVFCWLAATLVVIGWHVPALFEVGMRSAGWHAFEMSTFFAAGLLFWWPVVQPWRSIADWPRWSIPLYLFLATIPCDALSAFLTFCGRVVYPHYLSSPNALPDQERAGALMWVWVTFVYLAPAAAITIQMLSPQRPSDAELSSQNLDTRSGAPIISRTRPVGTLNAKELERG